MSETDAPAMPQVETRGGIVAYLVSTALSERPNSM